MKNPLAPAGIEPATFRFVAQYLNHCATAVPKMKLVMCLNTQWTKGILFQAKAPETTLGFGILLRHYWDLFPLIKAVEE